MQCNIRRTVQNTIQHSIAIQYDRAVQRNTTQRYKTVLVHFKTIREVPYNATQYSASTTIPSFPKPRPMQACCGPCATRSQTPTRMQPPGQCLHHPLPLPPLLARGGRRCTPCGPRCCSSFVASPSTSGRRWALVETGARFAGAVVLWIFYVILGGQCNIGGHLVRVLAGYLNKHCHQ